MVDREVARGGRPAWGRARTRRRTGTVLWICVLSGWMAGCGHPHGPVSHDAAGPGPVEIGERALRLLHEGDGPAAASLLEAPGREGGDGGAGPGDTGGDAVPRLLARAAVLEQAGDLGACDRLLALAQEKLEAAPGGNDRRRFFILVRRARLLQALGRVAEADACIDGAMQRARAMGRRGRRLETLAFGEKRNLLRATGAYEEALRRAVREHETLLGAGHPYVARGLYHLGILMEEQGRLEEAERYYLRSIDSYAAQLGPRHPAIAAVLNNLASMHRNNGAYEKAQPYLRRMVEIYEESLQRSDPAKLQALKNMVLRTQVDVTPVVRDLIRFEEEQLGPDHPHLAHSLRYYASLLESEQAYEEAESMLRRAVGIYERNEPRERPQRILTRKRLAQCLFAQGKAAEAVACTEETMALERQAHGDRPEVLLPTVYTLGVYLQGAGRFPEAEGALRRVLAYYRERRGEEDPVLQEVTRRLVEVLLAQQKDAAAGEFKKRLRAEKGPGRPGPEASSGCPRGTFESSRYRAAGDAG